MAPPGTPPAGFGGSGGYNQLTPPPKKKNTALIIILCLVGGVLLAGGIALFMIYGPPATARKDAQITEEYQQLLESICNAKNPAAIAKQRDRLDTFMYDNPGKVDTDLDKLVTACENYEYGDTTSKETFLSMISALERLENSSIAEVAACAETLLPDISSAYDTFAEASGREDAAPAEKEPAASPSDPFSDPAPLDKMDEEVYLEDDYYYFEFQNVSGKTINYIECWIFCYDENGDPLEGVAIDAGLENVEWETDDPYIVDGGYYTAEEHGVFKFYRCKGASFAIPFVSYIEFTDGTHWGTTDYVADVDEVFGQMIKMKALADTYAKTLVKA